ncbi:hypothetical protein C8T65DRAFT_744683 [Cerioporus squamosus]|nr:hypothetical protein C8T65DRAFT_744683 [Cerioporus squamosus]
MSQIQRATWKDSRVQEIGSSAPAKQSSKGSRKHEVKKATTLLESTEALDYHILKRRLKPQRLRSRPCFSGMGKVYGLDICNTLHVEWHKKGLHYINPNDYRITSLYGLDVFAQTIRQAWFKCPRSFGWTIIDRFSLPLPDKPEAEEILAPILTPVATAVYTY